MTIVQLKQFTECFDQLDKEIIEFGNFGLHFEVHCCIYAKFRWLRIRSRDPTIILVISSCLHRDTTFCGRSIRQIVHNVMFLVTRYRNCCEC